MKRLIIFLVFLLSISLASAISVNSFGMADLGFNGFVVEANLDTSGTAQVLYGKTGALGSASSLVSSSSEHLLQVDGLQENTVYFYRVVGKDSSGNSYSSAISLTRTPGNTGTSSSYTNDNSNDIPSGTPVGKLIWNTGFETDQWGANGVNPPPGKWEVDHGIPRTTDHPDAAIRKGRDGTGRALWLGDYNGGSTRNEVTRDRLTNWEEHWIGFSMYIDEAAPPNRPYAQWRNLAPHGQGTNKGVVNPITLRQGSSGKMYFSLATVLNNVDVVAPSGASTGTRSYPSGGFDYKLNDWIDIVIHWKLAFGANYKGPSTAGYSPDPRTDGYFEIWVNGKKIVDHVGTTTYRYSNLVGIEVDGDINPHIGPYWSSNYNPQGNIYYDNYRIWKGSNGYNMVSPK